MQPFKAYSPRMPSRRMARGRLSRRRRVASANGFDSRLDPIRQGIGGVRIDDQRRLGCEHEPFLGGSRAGPAHRDGDLASSACRLDRAVNCNTVFARTVVHTTRCAFRWSDGLLALQGHARRRRRLGTPPRGEGVVGSFAGNCTKNRQDSRAKLAVKSLMNASSLAGSCGRHADARSSFSFRATDGERPVHRLKATLKEADPS
jgi:hypothetical protein